MEDNLWWNTTFDGIQPLMEDNLWLKTNFDGRHFDGGRPFMEDNIWWRTTFYGGQPLMEDTFEGSFIEDEFEVEIFFSEMLTDGTIDFHQLCY